MVLKKLQNLSSSEIRAVLRKKNIDDSGTDTEIKNRLIDYATTENCRRTKDDTDFLVNMCGVALSEAGHTDDEGDGDDKLSDEYIEDAPRARKFSPTSYETDDNSDKARANIHRANTRADLSRRDSIDSRAYQGQTPSKSHITTLAKEAKDIKTVVKRSVADIEVLLAEINKSATVFYWSDSDKLIILKLKMSADLIRQSGIQDINTYAQAEQCVRRRLGRNQDRVAQELASLERGPNESVMNCFYRLLELLDNPGSGYKYLPTQFKRSFIKDNLKKVMPRSMFMAFISAWSSSNQNCDLGYITDLVEQLSGAIGQQKSAVNFVGYDDVDEYDDFDHYGDVNAVAARGPSRCHFCKRFGHFMTNCPDLEKLRGNSSKQDATEKRLELLEQKLEKATAQNESTLSAILKKLEGLDTRAANAVDTEHSPPRRQEPKPQKNQQRGKPRCYHCPLGEDGFPPRHFASACPYSSKNQQ